LYVVVILLLLLFINTYIAAIIGFSGVASSWVLLKSVYIPHVTGTQFQVYTRLASWGGTADSNVVSSIWWIWLNWSCRVKLRWSKCEQSW